MAKCFQRRTHINLDTVEPIFRKSICIFPERKMEKIFYSINVFSAILEENKQLREFHFFIFYCWGKRKVGWVIDIHTYQEKKAIKEKVMLKIRKSCKEGKK